ncbi:MAG: anhydro-N-acetylmuramic acid kinase [Flavobacteriia bacterium]|nr:anhydro-N-acetylmuramic acid kinase [Flavobacteriia bacterium]
MQSFYYLGLMSGTSLDGADIVYVEFKKDKSELITFDLIASKTYNYSQEWVSKLSKLTEDSALNFCKTDVYLAVLFSSWIEEFIKEFQIDKNKITAIGSHGHTIFHQIDKKFSTQIGNGNTISVMTQLPVVCDFRMKNVQYGGQGAPLVPVGDFDLFSLEADSFLNIGGICNISYKQNNQIIAYDICPGNLPLNKLSQLLGKKYDKNGLIAKSGEINFFLLDMLNELPFYKINKTKSLGVEWLENEFYPLIKMDHSIEKNLRTIVEHIAIQVAKVLNDNNINSVLLSGGGAKNTFLVERIQHYYKGKIKLPSTSIIDYKEAIIFAYLAHLRWNNQNNCLSSVTGSKKDMCTGVIYYP